MLKANPSIALNVARFIPKENFKTKAFQPIQQQRRTLFSSNGGSNRIINYRRLNKLEQEANASPTDAFKQATLYKVQTRTLGKASFINALFW